MEKKLYNITVAVAIGVALLYVVAAVLKLITLFV